MDLKIPLTTILLITTMAITAASSNVMADTVQNVSMQFNQAAEHGNFGGPMSKTLSFVALLALPFFMSLGTFIFLNNSLISKEESVMTSWSQIEANYQRRADLIPNLVASVNQFIGHEKTVLLSVTEERASAGKQLLELSQELQAIQNKSQESMRDLSPDDTAAIERAITAQSALGNALGKIIATSESYPELRSSDQFLTLLSQIEGSENRINIARMRFNEEVGSFNASIRRIPTSVVASIGGFQRKGYFKAEAGTEQAGSVFN